MQRKTKKRARPRRSATVETAPAPEGAAGVVVIDRRFGLYFVHGDWVKGEAGYPEGEMTCFEYFLGGATPCLHCGAREALETGRAKRWLKGMNGGKAVEILSIPVLGDRAEPLVINLIAGGAAMEAMSHTFDESLHRLREVGMLDSLWEMDEQGICLYCSSKITSVLGYEPRELVGQSLFRFVVPEDRQRCKARFFAAVKLKEAILDYEYSVFTKDERRACLLTSATPVIDEAGRLRGYHGISKDITERRAMEQTLREREAELRERSRRLEDANTALKVLLDHRDAEKKELEAKFLANMQRLIVPYVQRLRKTRLDEEQGALLSILDTCLQDVLSSFLQKSMSFNFTPRELEIVNLIRQGHTTKEIADLLHIATSAVDSHRHNIRAKLGILREKVNLQSRLLSLS